MNKIPTANYRRYYPKYKGAHSSDPYRGFLYGEIPGLTDDDGNPVVRERKKINRPKGKKKA